MKNNLLISETKKAVIKKVDDIVIKHLKAEGFTAESELHFAQEYKILNSLDIPGIPKVKDIEYKDGGLTLSLGYIDAIPLDEYFKDLNILENKEGLEHFLDIMAKVCKLLGDLHSQSIIHRNISTEHILISSAGTPFLISFGHACSFNVKIEQTRNIKFYQNNLANN